jgi:hypothetical protein
LPKLLSHEEQPHLNHWQLLSTPPIVYMIVEL